MPARWTKVKASHRQGLLAMAQLTRYGRRKSELLEGKIRAAPFPFHPFAVHSYRAWMGGCIHQRKADSLSVEMTRGRGSLVMEESLPQFLFIVPSGLRPPAFPGSRCSEDTTFLTHSVSMMTDPQVTLLHHTRESLHPPCHLCSSAQP